ncbi:MAG: hypothetical protein ACT4NT_07480 [Nitrososphaerota archaeon]
MEWENLDNKYAGKEISDIIRGSLLGETVSGVIVLLGRNLQNPATSWQNTSYSFQPASQTPTSYQHMHNWVNFEVGVSAGVRKPVVVFEEYNQFIMFPIPYVTDYCQFVLDSDDHIKSLGDFLEAKFLRIKRFQPWSNIRCPYDNCNAEYACWSEPSNNKMNCPVCRHEISFTQKEQTQQKPRF